MIVDLRSDTVTKPTPEMLAYMMNAEVGDDVYGEDPTVNSLEEKTAAILGKEAGLFTPSGTMANQIAIYLQTDRGSSVLAEEDSHVYLYEAGAAAAQSGIQFDLIPFSENLSDRSIENAIKPEWLHYATTKLMVIENTHNRGSGRVLNSDELNRISAKARSHGLRLHCDGARLWNAASALSCSESTLTAPFDTVSVCFSKGLGAPVGSVLVGDKQTITKARKIRKRWGGGMRQAGYLAAGCLYALDHNRPRLIDDHKKIGYLGDALKHMQSQGRNIEIFLPKLYTNLLYFRIPGVAGDEIVEKLRLEGILTSHIGQNKVRIVTHMQATNAGIEAAINSIGRILR